MRLKSIFGGLTFTGLVSTASAHAGEDAHHMAETAHMHGGFFMGFFMITLWVFVVVATIYLLQKISMNMDRGGEE